VRVRNGHAASRIRPHASASLLVSAHTPRRAPSLQPQLLTRAHRCTLPQSGTDQAARYGGFIAYPGAVFDPDRINGGCLSRNENMAGDQDMLSDVDSPPGNDRPLIYSFAQPYRWAYNGVFRRRTLDIN
jgi:hypothetical protein